MPKHFGLKYEPLSITDWVMGTNSPLAGEVLSDGDWTNFLPEKEYQFSRFDTMGCVSFSACNNLEILFEYFKSKRQIPTDDMEWLEDNGYLKNGKFNFSDRYIAKMSGTTSRGNSFRRVGDTIDKYGLVPEDDWSFDKRFVWDTYYAPVPQSVVDKGLSFKKRFNIYYEFLPSVTQEALKQGPLQVGIYAWTGKDSNGMYRKRTKTSNHAVTLFSYVDGNPMIFDHYDSIIKGMVKDYNFGGAVRFKIDFINKDKPMAKFYDNTLLQEVESSGSFGLYVDGKLYVDELDKLLATWMMRTNGNTGNKTATVLKADWDKFEKYDLKNNKL